MNKILTNDGITARFPLHDYILGLCTLYSSIFIFPAFCVTYKINGQMDGRSLIEIRDLVGIEKEEKREKMRTR